MTGRFSCLGLSNDGRTNKWRLTLPCGHQKEPNTTMFSSQMIQCDHCGREFVVDYNSRTMKEPE